MKMLMTFICMPFITVIVAEVFRDFYLGIVLSVGLSFLTYMLWDKFFQYREEEKQC